MKIFRTNPIADEIFSAISSRLTNSSILNKVLCNELPIKFLYPCDFDAVTTKNTISSYTNGNKFNGFDSMRLLNFTRASLEFHRRMGSPIEKFVDLNSDLKSLNNIISSNNQRFLELCNTERLYISAYNETSWPTMKFHIANSSSNNPVSVPISDFRLVIPLVSDKSSVFNTLIHPDNTRVTEPLFISFFNLLKARHNFAKSVNFNSFGELSTLMVTNRPSANSISALLEKMCDFLQENTFSQIKVDSTSSLFDLFFHWQAGGAGSLSASESRVRVSSVLPSIISVIEDLNNVQLTPHYIPSDCVTGLRRSVKIFDVMDLNTNSSLGFLCFEPVALPKLGSSQGTDAFVSMLIPGHVVCLCGVAPDPDLASALQPPDAFISLHGICMILRECSRSLSLLREDQKLRNNAVLSGKFENIFDEFPGVLGRNSILKEQTEFSVAVLERFFTTAEGFNSLTNGKTPLSTDLASERARDAVIRAAIWMYAHTLNMDAIQTPNDLLRILDDFIWTKCFPQCLRPKKGLGISYWSAGLISGRSQVRNGDIFFSMDPVIRVLGYSRAHAWECNLSGKNSLKSEVKKICSGKTHVATSGKFPALNINSLLGLKRTVHPRK